MYLADHPNLLHHYVRAFFINVISSAHWAWMDTKCRYRRSVIGPFWETINVFVLICGMSFVSGAIFNTDMSKIIPYVGLGIITWFMIVTSVNEAAMCFTGNAELIKNSHLGIGSYVGRNVFRIFITAAHHIVIYFFGVLVLPIPFGWEALLAILGVLILFLNAVWVMPTLGMLCARFRDMEMIVKNLMQLAFFVTPIFWDASKISDSRRFIVELNPFYYFIEMVRSPLLGVVPPMHYYVTVLSITVAGYLLLWLVYTKMRRNLAFYV